MNDTVLEVGGTPRDRAGQSLSQLPKPQSLRALEPAPRIADGVDDYLAGLTHEKLQVLVRNISNPQFRQELEQEEGVDAAAIFGRLQQAGFLAPPAAAPQRPSGTGIPPLFETDPNRIRERFNRDPQLRQFSGR